MVHTRKLNIFNDGAASSIAYDRYNNYLYVTVPSQNKVIVYDYSNVRKPAFVHNIDLSPYFSNIVDMDVDLRQVAVVGHSDPYSPGKLVFFDEKGKGLGQFSTGPGPKSVSFYQSGYVVGVASEGAPKDDYSIDPIGSISILEISTYIQNLPPSAIETFTFEKLDSTAYDPLIRVFGNNGNQLPSKDIEPENIAFSNTTNKAYITLQENNAIAIVDVFGKSLDTIIGLGYKDHTTAGLDASDTKASIDIATYTNLFGLYQPDGIAAHTINGNTYLFTANEGAYRDYTSYSEIAHTYDFAYDPSVFTNQNILFQDSGLGRLKITNTMGNFNNDFYQDSLFSFGARSFSIWDDNGQLVWDSGDEFEQLIAQMFPNEFNSSSSNNSSRKSRSDDMGPQPESIVVGEIDGTPYAFIGIKEMGGFMVYDVSSPSSPQFVMYELNRDFTVSANDANAGDLGVSDLEFIPSSLSPSGLALLIVANEVSGTITTYELGIGVGLDEGYPTVEESIYPNPSNGIFNTTYEGNYNVYNLDGKLVKTIQAHTVIDLSDQPNGIYIIKNEEGVALRALKK